jgi:hypothetical protein
MKANLCMRAEYSSLPARALSESEEMTGRFAKRVPRVLTQLGVS